MPATMSLPEVAEIAAVEHVFQRRAQRAMEIDPAAVGPDAKVDAEIDGLRAVKHRIAGGPAWTGGGSRSALRCDLVAHR